MSKKCGPIGPMQHIEDVPKVQREFNVWYTSKEFVEWMFVYRKTDTGRTMQAQLL